MLWPGLETVYLFPIQYLKLIALITSLITYVSYFIASYLEGRYLFCPFFVLLFDIKSSALYVKNHAMYCNKISHNSQ